MRYRQTVGIVAKLRAAGLGKPRDPTVIRADIAAVEKILRRLRTEEHRARASEIMHRIRSRPDFEAKRLAGLVRLRASPGYDAMRKEVASRTPHPNRLPDMTAEQKRQYTKLRYAHKQTREIALAAVLR